MGPKKEFKSKKQLEEEAKKKKEDDLKRKKEEDEKKRMEDEILKKQEEELFRKKENERLAKEEFERLKVEEIEISPWLKVIESKFQNSHNTVTSKEEWVKYSNCEENFLSVREEKDLTAFIYEFKERCDTTFISNFVLKEKNLNEEINFFDISETHCYSLYRLYLESKAIYNNNLKNYSLQYLNSIREIEKQKMESITKYFVENFEHEKKKIDDEKKSKESKDELDKSVEFNSKKGLVKFALWINSSDFKFREAKTKFKNSYFQIIEIPKNLTAKSCIIRIFWMQSDMRELQIREFSPYISISGFFITDLIYHPDQSSSHKSWFIRTMVEDKYKISATDIINTQKFKIKIELPSYVYVKDLDTVKPARYNEETGLWNFDNIDVDEFDKEKKLVSFFYNDLGTFAIVLDRKLSFPYVNWYLRCIDKQTAILDLTTPRLKIILEIGKEYVMLIKNEEKEFAYFANQKLKFDQILIEFRNCGIILNPLDSDLDSYGYKVKDSDCEDRAILDIVMASRMYAIRSHSSNLKAGEKVVLTKFKNNIEHDLYFFDDEEKDWFSVAWYSNKSIICKVNQNESEVEIESLVKARPYFHLLIKDKGEDNIFIEIEDVKYSKFLANLRNLLRLLRLTSFC